MKKLTPKSRFALLGVAAGALALSISLARAQDPATNDLRGRTQNRVGALFTKFRQARSEMNLTDAQRDQMRALMQKNAPQFRAILADKSLSRDEKRLKLEALHQQTKAEATKFLTADQIQKGEALKNQGKAALFQTLGEFSKELELTPDQQTKIRAIVWQSFQAGAQTGAPRSFSERRQRIEATVDKINVILTPGQQSKFAMIRRASKAEVMKQMLAHRAVED